MGSKISEFTNRIAEIEDYLGCKERNRSEEMTDGPLDPPHRKTSPTHQPLYRMMRKVIPGRQNRCMHLLHGIPQLDSKSTQYTPLPRIIFRIRPCLHLLLINNAHPKRFLLPDISNVNRAVLILVRSFCQFASESRGG